MRWVVEGVVMVQGACLPRRAATAQLLQQLAPPSAHPQINAIP